VGEGSASAIGRSGHSRASWSLPGAGGRVVAWRSAPSRLGQTTDDAHLSW